MIARTNLTEPRLRPPLTLLLLAANLLGGSWPSAGFGADQAVHSDASSRRETPVEITLTTFMEVYG